MGAAVMRRDDLEVFDFSSTISVVVLDAYVRKLNVLILVRQPVCLGPLPNLVGRPVGSPVTISPMTIPLLEEALILALELVVEDHAPDVATAFSDLFCSVLVGSVKVHIVRDFGPPGKACVVPLAVIERAVLRRVQQIAATLRERHERGPGTPSTKGAGLDEIRVLEVFELPIAVMLCPGVGWLEVTSRHGAERADSREQPNIRSR